MVEASEEEPFGIEVTGTVEVAWAGIGSGMVEYPESVSELADEDCTEEVLRWLMQSLVLSPPSILP